jgi:CHAT domain-containing protein
LQVASRGYGAFYRGGLADVAMLSEALPALPETADEARAVARSLGGSDRDVVLGASATETALKQADLSKFRVLYFATHGLLAGEVEGYARIGAEPALVLSLPATATELDDGLLTASEAAQLRLNADWVVLSACNTAAGDTPGAEALSGLARAFFYAGGRSLLVSHWPVGSDSAVALMTLLFDKAAADTTERPAEALRQAMLSVMASPENPEWANPAFWAPFVLVGEPRFD